MATILSQVGLGSVDKLVHDTAAALIEGDIPGKVAGAVNGFVTSGLGIVGDVLGIVRDVTAPEPPAAPPPAAPGP